MVLWQNWCWDVISVSVNKNQAKLKKKKEKVELWEQNRESYMNMHSSLNIDTENSKSN